MKRMISFKFLGEENSVYKYNIYKVEITRFKKEREEGIKYIADLGTDSNNNLQMVYCDQGDPLLKSKKIEDQLLKLKIDYSEGYYSWQIDCNHFKNLLEKVRKNYFKFV